MAPFVSARAPAWTLIVGGKPMEAFRDDPQSGETVRHRPRLQVRRQSLGPQTVLLRPRWLPPAEPAQALPPLGIA